jgi:hypothetical protein
MNSFNKRRQEISSRPARSEGWFAGHALASICPLAPPELWRHAKKTSIAAPFMPCPFGFSDGARPK